MEDADAGHNVDHFSQNRDIICIEFITTRSKSIRSLSISKENGLLTLMNYKLRHVIEIFTGLFPDKSRIVTLVFY